MKGCERGRVQRGKMRAAVAAGATRRSLACVVVVPLLFGVVRVSPRFSSFAPVVWVRRGPHGLPGRGRPGGAEAGTPAAASEPRRGAPFPAPAGSATDGGSVVMRPGRRGGLGRRDARGSGAKRGFPAGPRSVGSQQGREAEAGGAGAEKETRGAAQRPPPARSADTRALGGRRGPPAVPRAGVRRHRGSAGCRRRLGPQEAALRHDAAGSRRTRPPQIAGGGEGTAEGRSRWVGKAARRSGGAASRTEGGQGAGHKSPWKSRRGG